MRAFLLEAGGVFFFFFFSKDYPLEALKLFQQDRQR